ncbi:MAG: S8 family serine peptidase [Hyphomonadaceae bacterium]|nr:S8 family serine peptidase [Hyphomonadaceae bacterium]
MNTLKISALVLNAVVLAMLGACASGGGGGGGGSPPVSPPPPPPFVFPPLAPPHAPGDFPNASGSEYNANWGVAGTNAIVAWQNNATGAGVLVGVIDDGIDPNHPELIGRISPNSIDIVSGRNALVTTQSHGSEISSLIAGNYNNSQTVGVAFDATILAIRADNGNDQFTSADLANAIDYARQQGVDVINLSLGGASPSSQAVRDAIRRATQAGVIIVVSAGNDGNSGATQPNYPGFLATDPSIANGLIMIAGGLNQNGTVNTASNPPGTAADWYLTAPGWSIIVPDHGPPGAVPGFQTCGLGPNGDLCRIQGTSYASPHVAGAVALVMDGFPGLTPAQVVDLLFTTADDTGPIGTDSLNGRGRLNIGRAFQPVGPLAVPMASTSMSMSSTSLIGMSGPAFGDGITRHVETWSVVGFDNYQRTFPVELADNWLSASRHGVTFAQAPQLWRSEATRAGFLVQSALTESLAPETLRAQVDRADFERAATRIEATLGEGLSVAFAANGARTIHNEGDPIGHLDFVGAERSLRLTQRIGRFAVSLVSESGSVRGAPLSYALIEPASERSALAGRAELNLGAQDLAITLGRLSEETGVLGLSWNRLLGATPDTATDFVGLNWRYAPAPGWDVSVSGETGTVSLSEMGWLRVEEPLRTSSFMVVLTRDFTPSWLSIVAPDGDGALSFTLSQPLRVEGGALTYMAPTATKWGRRSLRFEERRFEPTPSGRELRVGLGYHYAADDMLSAFAEAFYVQEPGHIAQAEPDVVLRVGARVAR